MGWWPWGGKEKQPDMSVGSRTVCYDHRDNYFACLGASCPHSLLACWAAYRCASVCLCNVAAVEGLQDVRLGPGAAAAIRSSRPLTSMCSGACREERRGKLCLHCGGEEGAVAYLHHTVPMNHPPSTLSIPLHTP